MSQSVIRGDFPANPPNKAGYYLEFQDEFDSDSLDTTKWLPYYLAQWSSRASSAPNYVFEPSNLVLQITQDQQAWCPEFDGEVKVSSLQTGIFAGAVGSPFGQHRFNQACVVRESQTNTQLYTPQYGYFEIRAKGDITPRNVIALWMIGYEDVPEKSGEIAIFEIFGKYATPTTTQVNYGVHPWDDTTITDEFYKDLFPIDASQYHIYAVEWTPTHIDFYLDNQKIRTIHQSLHYPMQFMLNIYELPLAPDADMPAESYPKRLMVDYVRGYQLINGY
jgi:hypothetical protein